MSLALGIEDDPGQSDGPSESAKLCYPAGLTARGACLYIAEHPSEIQGAITMACSREGLVDFNLRGEKLPREWDWCQNELSPLIQIMLLRSEREHWFPHCQN